MSFARLVEASCHSFVIVFGGGGARRSQAELDQQEGSDDGPIERMNRWRPTAIPQRPVTDRNIFKLSPGLLTGALGPCGPKAMKYAASTGQTLLLPGTAALAIGRTGFFFVVAESLPVFLLYFIELFLKLVLVLIRECLPVHLNVA